MIQKDRRISETPKRSSFKKDFIDYIDSKYALSKVSQKLSAWNLLESKGFLSELKKAKIKVDEMQEFSLLKLFKQQKQKAQALQSQIDQIDKEIDQMVYELYGLTEEEIGIVEGNV